MPSIQDDSEGKVNIVRDDSMGHCQKKKSSNEHMSNSERLPKESCLNVQMKTLDMVAGRNYLLLNSIPLQFNV